MTFPISRPTSKLAWIGRSLSHLTQLSWAWRITLGYLSIMLLLPISAMLLKASTTQPAEFFRIALSPVALSTYDVTFVTALIAAAIDGLFGTLIAWILVRYDFPFKKVIDASIDLPFALPTAVAGLTLATVYSDNGWIGSLLAPFGIRVSFTRLASGSRWCLFHCHLSCERCSLFLKNSIGILKKRLGVWARLSGKRFDMWCCRRCSQRSLQESR